MQRNGDLDRHCPPSEIQFHSSYPRIQAQAAQTHYSNRANLQKIKICIPPKSFNIQVNNDWSPTTVSVPPFCVCVCVCKLGSAIDPSDGCGPHVVKAIIGFVLEAPMCFVVHC